MASREFIMDRIQKAQENIEKKQKTLARHQKALDKLMAKVNKYNLTQEELWERRFENPEYMDATQTWFDIEYKRDDIKRTEEAIREAQERFNKYTSQLKAEEEKDASRDVKVILEFLEMWKNKVTIYYHKSFPKYLEEYAERCRQNSEYCNLVNYHKKEYTKDQLSEIRKKERDRKELFNGRWHWIMPYVDYTYNDSKKEYFFNDEKLQKDLSMEANRKYDFIIERTNEIVGQITDASQLTIGYKDDLNGYIIGTRGTASVNTIGAGGYNVQCFHFRTLIREVK